MSQTQEQRILSAIMEKSTGFSPEQRNQLQDRLLQWAGLVQRCGLLQSWIFAERKSKTAVGWEEASKLVSSVLVALDCPRLSAETLRDESLIGYQRLQLMTLEVTSLAARYFDALQAAEESR